MIVSEWDTRGRIQGDAEMTKIAQGEAYANATQEDRSAVRVRCTMPATLRPIGSKSLQTVVKDLSPFGFSATAISPIHKGTVCWLTIPGLEPVAAKAVWWDKGTVGCEFARLLQPNELTKMTAKS
ncbi:hypothetical protein HNO88_004499 [Novosphingobium chloroacetimidivorans]|uniref:PilZ domain-containing protein n=1 Tax=Novosphingobium chloroacetimidivorans TaxID=1428314 RepID=A0A7W7KE21_9SPHN|nr:PilZ domain-containing protein [Novosphingobium chloroacetimidivorans]MBB4861145.1 hypothetical protein [Novosphingobium chloroacetimidivorans]